MKAMLQGYRRIDMVDDRTGRPVRGFSCFISYPSDGVVGVETTKQYISDELANSCGWSPEINKLVNLDFTPKGRVCSVSTVKEK